MSKKLDNQERGISFMEPDALWTIKEVAAFFKKKSTRTIDGWCALDGDPLPFIATPGGKMFDPDEVRKWVHRRSFNSIPREQDAGGGHE